MSYVIRVFETETEIGEEFICYFFLWVRENDIDVSTIGFATTISTYDYNLETRIEGVGVGEDGGGNGFDFGTGDAEGELVVVF